MLNDTLPPDAALFAMYVPPVEGLMTFTAVAKGWLRSYVAVARYDPASKVVYDTLDCTGGGNLIASAFTLVNSLTRLPLLVFALNLNNGCPICPTRWFWLMDTCPSATATSDESYVLVATLYVCNSTVLAVVVYIAVRV